MNIRYLLSFLLLITVSFTACTKSVNSRTGSDNSVRVRFLNHTSFPVINAMLGNESYGTVQPGETSAYHSFTGLVGPPGLSCYNDTTDINFSIGFCGSPMPPYLENGDYLYTLSTDTLSYNGCTYSFVKE